MVKVYLVSQINKVSSRTIKRSVEEANLISRRIFLGGGLPIAPSLWYLGYDKDPRIRHTISWWVKNVFTELMKDCEIMCYKPNLIGVDVELITYEKTAWAKLHPTKPQVASDVILDFLLQYNAEVVLNDKR